MRNHLGAVFKRGKFKYAYWAVPNNGASNFKLCRQLRRSLGADVQNQIVVRHFSGFFDGRNGIGSKCFGTHNVGRNWHLCTTGFHRGHHGFGLRQQIRFGQTFADLQSSSQYEGIRNTAAND